MRPLLPVIAYFISGIAASVYLSPSIETLFILVFISIAFVLGLHLVKARFNALAGASAFFFLGALFITPYVKPDLTKDHVKNLIETDAPGHGASELSRIEAVIDSGPDFSADGVRFRAEAKRFHANGAWKDASGCLELNIKDATTRLEKGDHVRLAGRLREPSNYGNPGEYDRKWRLNAGGVFVTAFVKNASGVTLLEARHKGASAYVERYRSMIRGLYDRMDIENREPLKALIIGDKRGITAKTKDAFAKTGTAHILAISGLHVGIVALFSYNVIFFIMRRSERLLLLINAKKQAMLLAFIPVFAYGLIAGFPVSTERAVIMYAVWVITVLLNRGRDLINVLALAALVILVKETDALYDISFQLTFAAVLSIVYLVPLLKDYLPISETKTRLPAEQPLGRKILKKALAWLVPAVLTTLSATIGTAPIIAYHFHRVSLAGTLANLLVVPLTGVIVPMVFASALVLPLWEGLAGVIILITDKLFGLLAVIVGFFASLPYSSIWVTTPTMAEITLIYVLIVSVANLKKGRAFKYLAILSLVALSIESAYWTIHQRWNRDLRVTLLSVGQGESAFIEFPGGKTMLIDGGGLYGSNFDTGERIVAPFLWHKKIDAIDYMVLSHAQRDHMAGLRFIAENFKVKEFWWNGEGDLKGLGRALKKRNTVIREIDSRSEGIDIGGVGVETLNPLPGSGLDQNDNSLVLRLVYGGKSFLFTGDIGEGAEKALYSSRRDISATVLKSPHHGSRYSSSSVFLDKVAPAIAAISAGRDNPFGFPHKETLDAYASRGVKVIRTDEAGAIEFTTDGRYLNTSGYLTGPFR